MPKNKQHNVFSSGAVDASVDAMGLSFQGLGCIGFG